MPFVYAGRYIRLDLSTGQFSINTIDDADVRKYLLGSGYAAKLFADEESTGRDRPLAQHPAKCEYAPGPGEADGGEREPDDGHNGGLTEPGGYQQQPDQYGDCRAPKDMPGQFHGPGDGG